MRVTATERRISPPATALAESRTVDGIPAYFASPFCGFDMD